MLQRRLGGRRRDGQSGEAERDRAGQQLCVELAQHGRTSKRLNETQRHRGTWVPGSGRLAGPIRLTACGYFNCASSAVAPILSKDANGHFAAAL